MTLSVFSVSQNSMWRKEELLDNCLTIGAGAVATARHMAGGYIGLIPFPAPDLLKGLNLMEI